MGASGLCTPGPVRSTVRTAFLHCSFCGGFIGPPRPKRRPAGSSHSPSLVYLASEESAPFNSFSNNSNYNTSY